MISENSSPAMAGKRVPFNDADAIARVAELMAESPEGLIGSVFLSLEQFKLAMADGGWKIEAQVYAESETATTWIGVAQRRERTFKFILNSYGSYIEICNCFGAKEKTPTPETPTQKTPIESPFARLRREGAT